MKGLEKLKEIKDDVVAEYINDYKEHFDIIEKELKEKETQDGYIEMLEDRINNLETSYSRVKKALEIIKEHILYCENVDCFVFVNVTKEVNDLLKEVLNG